jgi:4-aminobutyrate aminotransferase-like enzyme
MRSHRPRGAVRTHDPLSDLVFTRGEGAYVWDTLGRKYLDMICGYSACSLGHAHPRLLRVAEEQMRRLVFAHSGQSVEREVLEERLSQRIGISGGFVKTWLCTGGARAVELAWKIAFAHRPGCVARFDLGYHGRSLGAALLSDTRRSAAMDDASFNTLILPFPREASRGDAEGEGDSVLALRRAAALFQSHGKEISMLLMEPAIGSRGYYFAPPWYFRQLAALTRSHGALVVSDEIQMGLGRLGALSAAIRDGWDPDLVILGKSLGGGMLPISAVAGRAELLDGLPEGIESETFAAAPLACRIASEVLEILDEESWVERAEPLGTAFRMQLRSNLPPAVRIDGCGLATVLSLATYGEHSESMARQWTRDLCEAGLLVHLTGPERNRLALIPPLNLETERMAEAAGIIASTFVSRKDEPC